MQLDSPALQRWPLWKSPAIWLALLSVIMLAVALRCPADEGEAPRRVQPNPSSIDQLVEGGSR